MPPASRALSRQDMLMMVMVFGDVDVDDLQSKLAKGWLMIVYIMHGQVKELTYMHSEGIQVTFETEILGIL